MPPSTRKRTVKPVTKPEDTQEFEDWDLLVEESRVTTPPFQLRTRVPAEEEGGEDTFEFVAIPVPSGASYVNLAAAQRRGDVAGVVVNLTLSGPSDEENNALFDKLMGLLAGADFPVVDKLANRVLKHYFNAPPRAEDGSEGGAGESSAS